MTKRNDTSDDALPTGIGAPARRALEGAGCRTLASLRGADERALASLHGVGPKALRLLREALAARGWSLGEDAG